MEVAAQHAHPFVGRQFAAQGGQAGQHVVTGRSSAVLDVRVELVVEPLQRVVRRRCLLTELADGFQGDVKLLTSCPSCLQGLSRYNDDAGTQADYIVVEMARRLLGENWMRDYVEKANNGGIERVLL